MQETTIREKVLKRIRNAGLQNTSQPYPNIDMESAWYKMPSEDKIIAFAENFTQNKGLFFYVSDELEMVETLINIGEANHWEHFIAEDPYLLQVFNTCEFPIVTNAIQGHANIRIVPCCALAASSSSIVLSTLHGLHSSNGHACQILIVIASAEQISENLKDAMAKLLLPGHSHAAMYQILSANQYSNFYTTEKVAHTLLPSQLIVILMENWASINHE